MGIDKAGQHEFALQVDEFRVFCLIFQHLLVGADVHDDASLHADRRYHRVRVVDRFNDAVIEDSVHLFLLVWKVTRPMDGSLERFVLNSLIQRELHTA